MQKCSIGSLLVALLLTSLPTPQSRFCRVGISRIQASAVVTRALDWVLHSFLINFDRSIMVFEPELLHGRRFVQRARQLGPHSSSRLYCTPISHRKSILKTMANDRVLIPCHGHSKRRRFTRRSFYAIHILNLTRRADGLAYIQTPSLPLYHFKVFAISLMSIGRLQQDLH